MIRIVTTEGLRICHPTEDLFEGVSAMQGGIFMVDNRSGEERVDMVCQTTTLP